MPEKPRTELTPSIDSQANLGGLAITASAEINPFEVNAAELARFIPNLDWYREESQKIVSIVKEIDLQSGNSSNRQERRKPKTNITELNNFINATLWFMASCDSNEEVMKHDFFPNIRFLLHDEGIEVLKESAADLRDSEASRKQLAAEINSILDDDTNVYEQYTLLKAISYTDKRNLQDKDLEQEFLSRELSNRTTVASALASYGAEARQKLEDKARAGTFDRYIASDTMQLAMSSDESSSDLDKLREFNAFCISFGNRLATSPSEAAIRHEITATLESWPANYRQVITKTRDAILERLDVNSRRIKRMLNQSRITFEDDPELHLYQAADSHTKAILNTASIKSMPAMLRLAADVSDILGVEPPTAQELIAARRSNVTQPGKQAKRPRIKVEEHVEEPTESPKTPEATPTIVNHLERYVPSSRSCDNEISAVIRDFLKSINSNNKHHQDDVKAILQYMECNPISRSKVRTFTELKVKVMVGETVVKKPVHRFRPQIVPGLSNGTSDWRVAYIIDNKEGENTIGIVGLYHKSNWNSFTQKIKNGMREHN